MEDQRVIEKQPSMEHVLSLMSRFSNCEGSSSGYGSRALVLDKSDIVMFGNSWRCTKKHTHYDGFCRKGINIVEHSFIIIKYESTEYVGYVLALYEDEQRQKFATVRPFFHPEEMKKWYPNLELQSREVVIAQHKHEVRAECIDGLATVLTPDLFERGLKVLPEILASQTFVCYRQYHKKEVKQFCMTELHGFSTQPVLLLMSHLLLVDNQNKPSEGGEEKDSDIEEKVGKKTESQAMLYVVGEDIELLCQNIGMRGCWLRCKILQSKRQFIKVEYYDKLDAEGLEELEEWVPLHRVANPDKLGMRNAGRLRVRPRPDRDFSKSIFKVGAAVDAWKGDGWWEGVVMGYPTTSTSTLQVYFPDEHKFSTIERKSLRAAKDWIDNKWVKVEPNPNIYSLFTLVVNPQPRDPPLPALAKSKSLGVVSKEVDKNVSVEVAKDDKGKKSIS